MHFIGKSDEGSIAHSLSELADDIVDRLTECLGARRLTALAQRDKTDPQRRVSGAEAHVRDPTAVDGGGTWRNEIDQRPAESIADGARASSMSVTA